MSLPLNRFARAAVEAVGSALDVDPKMFQAGSPPRPEMGDFAVGCFPAARELKQSPGALAARVAEGFQATTELAEAVATGPFVNFRADRGALFSHLLTSALGEGELIDTSVGAGKTVCIDYSSPNISKHLAYHHIRSTAIGHALVNLHRAVGYRVIGINHLGDWGTTHGMQIAAYEMWGGKEPLTVSTLNDLYVRYREAMKSDDSLAELGRAWFKKLEDGDPRAVELWTRFREVSWTDYQSVYKLLGIEFEEVRGESAYVEAMPGVLDMLADKQLSTMSEGALVVPLDEHKLPPLLLKKQDGATLYGTRDLAAALYHWDTYHFERKLYVVDRGQGVHFKQLFLTLEKAGYQWSSRLEHVPFGLVRIGGKKTGTRSGNVVLLTEVLAEAQDRARERVAEANPDMAPDDLQDTARMVGVGAIVFANLSSQREKDVDFSWDDVLSTKGDSGPYIQYAHARCCRVLRLAEGIVPSTECDVSRLKSDLEWGVALKAGELADVVAHAAKSNDPHLLSRYLLDLCAVFSAWYTAGNTDKTLRMRTDDNAVSLARLSLVAATKRVLARGLDLLGLDAPEAM